MAVSEGVAGEARLASGVTGNQRLDPYSAQIVNDVGAGRYFEACRLSRKFSLSATGFTLVAANATALAATTQLVVGIVNTIGASKAAVITRVTTQTRSGTPAGPFYLTGALSSGGISTAAAGTIVTMNMSGVGSSMRAYNNVALTGFVAQGSIFQVAIGGPAAVAAGAGTYHSDIEFAGSIIVPPGGVCGILATGAGTTHIVDCSVFWTEIDWPL